jgi:hypothetical protein
MYTKVEVVMRDYELEGVSQKRKDVYLLPIVIGIFPVGALPHTIPQQRVTEPARFMHFLHFILPKLMLASNQDQQPLAARLEAMCEILTVDPMRYVCYPAIRRIVNMFWLAYDKSVDKFVPRVVVDQMEDGGAGETTTSTPLVRLNAICPADSRARPGAAVPMVRMKAVLSADPLARPGAAVPMVRFLAVLPVDSQTQGDGGGATDKSPTPSPILVAYPRGQRKMRMTTAVKAPSKEVYISLLSSDEEEGAGGSGAGSKVPIPVPQPVVMAPAPQEDKVLESDSVPQPVVMAPAPQEDKVLESDSEFFWKLFDALKRCLHKDTRAAKLQKILEDEFTLPSNTRSRKVNFDQVMENIDFHNGGATFALRDICKSLEPQKGKFFSKEQIKALAVHMAATSCHDEDRDGTDSD